MLYGINKDLIPRIQKCDIIAKVAAVYISLHCLLFRKPLTGYITLTILSRDVILLFSATTAQPAQLLPELADSGSHTIWRAPAFGNLAIPCTYGTVMMMLQNAFVSYSSFLF